MMTAKRHHIKYCEYSNTNRICSELNIFEVFINELIENIRGVIVYCISLYVNVLQDYLYR